MAHDAFGLCALRGGLDDDAALAHLHAYALADGEAGALQPGAAERQPWLSFAWPLHRKTPTVNSHKTWRQSKDQPMGFSSSLRFSVLFFALGMPMAGCAGNDNPPRSMHEVSTRTPTQTQTEDTSEDCSGISSLTDKRICYGRQDQAMIDECERIHPMRCSPYREMARAEARLAAVEETSLAAAETTYSS